MKKGSQSNGSYLAMSSKCVSVCVCDIDKQRTKERNRERERMLDKDMSTIGPCKRYGPTNSTDLYKIKDNMDNFVTFLPIPVSLV